MIDIIDDFFNMVQGLFNSDELKQATEIKPGKKMELKSNDGSFTLTVESYGPDRKAIPFSPEEIECKKLKKEFYDYVHKLDDSIFRKALVTLGRDKVQKLKNEIEKNSNDPKTMKSAIKTYKDTVNQVIQEEVTRLKSQMAGKLI